MTKNTSTQATDPAASGGPRTEVGKFESSKNAISHGLTAATIDRFPEHIREAYAAFLADQYAEHEPATANERDFLEQYAFNRFQISRAQAMLSETWEKVTANPGDETLEKKYQKLVRHVRALERTAKYALNELRTFIADRLTNSELDTKMPSFVQRGISVPVAFPAHRVLPPRPKPEELKNTIRAYVEELSTRYSVESICKPELLEAARQGNFDEKQAA